MNSHDDARQEIALAVRNYDIADSSIWYKFDELSTHTTVEDIEVDESGIVLDGESFRGVANVYLSLQFGRDDAEGFHESDSFLVEFSGHLIDGNVEVDKFEVDTSGRFEDD